MPSPSSKSNPVSLLGQPADVPQLGPTEEIVIGKVNSKPAPEPVPTPVVAYGKDGSITIK